MTLRAFEPDPMWDPEANAETVKRFAGLSGDAIIRIWCGDWCGDCRRELPGLAATIKAAEIPDERVLIYPVTEEKRGTLVEEYNVTTVPTVVIEVGTETRARFEESAPVPAPTALANDLADQ